MYKVKVYVTLRENILDVQGTAVKGALHQLAFDEVSDVRIGKYIELSTSQPTEENIKAMCEKLLANTVIEDYRFEVEEVVSQ